MSDQIQYELGEIEIKSECTVDPDGTQTIVFTSRQPIYKHVYRHIGAGMCTGHGWYTRYGAGGCPMCEP